MKRTSWATALALCLLPIVVQAGPVNVNTADAKTLARELKGIGLSRAQAIVDYREKNGPFKNAEELANVKGIGMKVVEDNRGNIKTDKADKAEKSKGEAASDKAPASH